MKNKNLFLTREALLDLYFSLLSVLYGIAIWGLFTHREQLKSKVLPTEGVYRDTKWIMIDYLTW